MAILLTHLFRLFYLKSNKKTPKIKIKKRENSPFKKKILEIVIYWYYKKVI